MLYMVILLMTINAIPISMYWDSRDIDEHCIYIHPYMKENYPVDYEKIKRLKESEGYTVIVDNFERRQCDKFK